MTTTTQTAYAPGSSNASSTTGVIAGIAQAASKALGFGGGGGAAQGAMGGIGIGVSTSSTATSGNAGQNAGYDGQDFNVNFGSGVSQGGGVPTWVIMAGALLGLWWYTR